MKNILGAITLVIMASGGMSASANALPALSVSGLSDQAASSVEQVGHRRHGGHFRFHGKHHFGGYGHGGYGHYYGGGNGYYWWKKYCYYNPYHWKCHKFGY